MTMMTGIVQEIGTKDVSTKFGVKPTYSIKVNGDWIKCGFKNPKVEVGYEVDFDAVRGTYGLETKGVNVLSSSPAPASAVATSGTVGSSSTKPFSTRSEKVFPIPALHGDRSIVRQNALARATDLFVSSQGNKAFALTDDVTEIIIRFAKHFESYTAGDRDLEEAIAETSAEEVK